MNKYQEALDFITDHTKADCKTIKDLEGLEFAYDILQELVDKEIPMKHKYDDYPPTCKKCNKVITTNVLSRSKYCNWCGQRIDWSDEE